MFLYFKLQEWLKRICTQCLAQPAGCSQFSLKYGDPRAEKGASKVQRVFKIYLYIEETPTLQKITSQLQCH